MRGCVLVGGLRVVVLVLVLVLVAHAPLTAEAQPIGSSLQMGPPDPAPDPSAPTQSPPLQERPPTRQFIPALSPANPPQPVAGAAGVDTGALLQSVLQGLESSAVKTATDIKTVLTDVISQTSAAAPSSLPALFHDVLGSLAKQLLSRNGGQANDVDNQSKLRTFYRRMLLIWKDILKSDIGNGNPLVAAVVAEWMRDLLPLEVWSSISYVTVNDMSRLMEDIMVWAQNDEKCRPNPNRVCNVDPLRMQFAVEFMRASMPLVLTGQIKLGLIKKFLSSFKRVSKAYPRLGFQILGLMKSNPPLILHAIMHMFSHDGPALDAIKGTSVEWGESPDITFYQLPNCVGPALASSLDEDLIDLCAEMFNNGQGVNLSAKSILLSPDSFVKLVSCPPNPKNKLPYGCAGNMKEECDSHCVLDGGATPDCKSLCKKLKTAKMTGYMIDDCLNPVTVKCVRTFYSQECVNVQEFHSVSYVWGKTTLGASMVQTNADEDCPA